MRAAWLREAAAVFLLALGFLTRLPVAARLAWSPARMAATPGWYPLAGAVVGALTGAAFWAAASVFPPVLAALIATAAGLLVTGALHEDGLADVCDGIGGGRTPERALEIMRDSRIGAYGALGLGLVVATKVAALASLPVLAVPLVLVAGHAASRAAMVAVIATGRYARAEGTAGPVAGGTGRGGLALGLATGAAAVALLILVVPAGAVAVGVAGLAAGYLAMRRIFERRLGGYTGDCLGAVQQTSELGLYLGLVAWL